MEEQSTTENNVTMKASQSYAIPFAIIVAGLAIASAIYFSEVKKIEPQPRAQGSGIVDPITKADHVLGNPKAKIAIIEYSDTECPFCKSFHPTMKQIMNEYGKDGKVAWVYRHFPLSFHTKAPKEAEATECANKLGGNVKFWEYLNAVFELSPGNDQLDPAELPKIAKTVGLDVDAFNACLSSGEMKKIVDAGIKSGENAGVSGTPYSIVLVDGEIAAYINGAQPYQAVKAQIDELLK